MCDAIAHRGPDGYGVWEHGPVALGHRRLSIIDIEGSPQPMASTDGRLMLVFNGEIYNYRELRAELAAQGARFHTDGDSEVIIAAYQRWGVDGVAPAGMFAFALYDMDRRTLLLARDRLGVKPLFTAPARWQHHLRFGIEGADGAPGLARRGIRWRWRIISPGAMCPIIAAFWRVWRSCPLAMCGCWPMTRRCPHRLNIGTCPLPSGAKDSGRPSG
jgi:hypothetical protein